MNKIKKVFLTVLGAVLFVCMGVAIAACGSGKKTQYSVNTEYISTQGTVTVSPEGEDGKWDEGTELTVTVTPQTGYAVDTFTVNGTDKKDELQNNAYTFTLVSDTDIAVTFRNTAPEVKKFSVTANTPENGTIKIAPAADAEGKYAENTEITVTLEPAQGYEVDTFTVNGTDKKGELQDNVYTFEISGETAINATFKSTPPEVKKFSVTANTPENGTIEITPAADAEGKYAENTEITVTLKPAQNFVVDTFTVNGSDKKGELQNNVYTFEISGETTINATFKATHTVSVTITPEGKATYTLAPAQGPYVEGSTVVLTLEITDEEYEIDSFTIGGVDAEWDEGGGYVKTLTVNSDLTVAIALKEIPSVFDSAMRGEWHHITPNGNNFKVAEEVALSVDRNTAKVDGHDATVDTTDGIKLTVDETEYTVNTIYEGAILALVGGDTTRYLIKSAAVTPVVLPKELQTKWAYGSESDPKIVEIKDDGTISLPFLGIATGTIIAHHADEGTFAIVCAYGNSFYYLVAEYEVGQSLKLTYNGKTGEQVQECRPAPTTLKVVLVEKVDYSQTELGGELVDFFCEAHEDFSFTKGEDGSYLFPVASEVAFKVKVPEGYTLSQLESNTLSSYPPVVEPNNQGFYVITTEYKEVKITLTYYKNSIFPAEYQGEWARISHGSTTAGTSATLKVNYQSGRDSITYYADAYNYDTASNLQGNATEGFTFSIGYGSSKTNYKIILIDGFLIMLNADTNSVAEVLYKAGERLNAVSLDASLVAVLKDTKWVSEGGSTISGDANGALTLQADKDIATYYGDDCKVIVLTNDAEHLSFTAFVDAYYGRYFTFTYADTDGDKTLTLKDAGGKEVVFTPAPETYSVTANVVKDGAVSTGATVTLSDPSSKLGGYKAGEVVTITVKLNVGFAIVSVTADHGTVTPSEEKEGVYTITVEQDTVITVTLNTVDTVKIVLQQENGSGAYLETADGSVYSNNNGTYTFNKGASVRVRTGKPTSQRPATVTYGETVLTRDDEASDASSSYEYYSFTADNGGIVKVVFVSRVRIEFTGTASNGTVEVEGANAYHSGSFWFVDVNVEFTFTVKPNEGYMIDAVTIGDEPIEGTDGVYKYTITDTVNKSIRVTFKVLPDPLPESLAGSWYIVSASGSNLTVEANPTLVLTTKKAEIDGENATITETEGGFTFTAGGLEYAIKEIYEGVLYSLSISGGATSYLIKGAVLPTVTVPKDLIGKWAYGSASDPTVIEITEDMVPLTMVYTSANNGKFLAIDTTERKFVAIAAAYGTIYYATGEYEPGKSVTFHFTRYGSSQEQVCTPAPTTIALTINAKDASNAKVEGSELTELFYDDATAEAVKNEDGTFALPVNKKVGFKFKAPEGYTLKTIKYTPYLTETELTADTNGYYYITTAYKAITINVTYWKDSVFTEEYVGDWCRISHGTTSAGYSTTLTIGYSGGKDTISYNYSSASNIDGNAEDGYTFTLSGVRYSLSIRNGVLIVLNTDANTVKDVLLKKNTSLKGIDLPEGLGLYNTSWTSAGGSLITIAEDGAMSILPASDISTTYPDGKITVLSSDLVTNTFDAFVDAGYGKYYTFKYDKSANTLTLTDACDNVITFDPTPATYSVTAKVTLDGAISEGATATLSAPKIKAGYTKDEEVTLTVKLTVGYEIVSVKVGEQTLEAQENGTYKTTVTGDTVFEIALSTYETVTVTYTKNSSSGTAYLESTDGSPYSGSGYNESVYTFKKGAEVTLRYSISTANRVVSITLTDEDGNETKLTATTGQYSTYDYYNFTADKNYTLVVEVVKTYVITIDPPQNGKVEIELGEGIRKNGNTDNSYIVDEGTTITIKVTPNEGYTVSAVKAGTSQYNGQDVTHEGDTYTYIVTANKTIYVTFVKVEA